MFRNRLIRPEDLIEHEVIRVGNGTYKIKPEIARFFQRFTVIVHRYINKLPEVFRFHLYMNTCHYHCGSILNFQTQVTQNQNRALITNSNFLVTFGLINAGMMSPLLLLLIIVCYFSILMVIFWFASRLIWLYTNKSGIKTIVWTDALVVLNHRGKGIGIQLLGFCEERILKFSPNVFICVSSFNTAAIKLYYKFGFKLVGELDNFVKAGFTELLLRKTVGARVGYSPQ